jgi:hypothetical protein
VKPPSMGRKGQSPRAWVERAKPPSVGEAPEHGSKRAKPPSMGEAPERGSKGQSPRAWAYTDVDSSNEELELYYLAPKAQYWVRTAADA